MGGLCARRRRRRRERAAGAGGGGQHGGGGQGGCAQVAAERRANSEWNSRTLLPRLDRPPQAPLWHQWLLRDPSPATSPSHPPPAAFLLPSARPARSGRGPPQCRPPWQRRPARGKSSPGISCGLAWFRLLPPRPRQLSAPQPHSGPPCLSCDRTDTAGGLEWNKLKAR